MPFLCCIFNQMKYIQVGLFILLIYIARESKPDMADEVE